MPALPYIGPYIEEGHRVVDKQPLGKSITGWVISGHTLPDHDPTHKTEHKKNIYFNKMFGYTQVGFDKVL